MTVIGHMPILAKDVAYLASIVFNAYFGLAQLALILRPRLFDFNRLRRLYFGLADFAAITFGAYTLAFPMWLQSSPALILRCHRFGIFDYRLDAFTTRLEAGWLHPFIRAVLSHYRRAHVARRERSVGTGRRS